MSQLPPRRSRPRQTSLQKTAIARYRKACGLTQARLAELTGISLPTIKRLERGEITHPSMRMLANCAKIFDALRVDETIGIDDLIEDQWREWFVFDAHLAPTPPPDFAARLGGAVADPYDH